MTFVLILCVVEAIVEQVVMALLQKRLNVLILCVVEAIVERTKNLLEKT